MKSSVKTSLVAAAVASTLGTAAYALPPTSRVDFTVYAAGGSAQTNAAFWAATQFLSNVDSYTDQSTGGNSPSYRVLFGTTTKTIGTIASGKNVLFFYKFNGGSFPNGAQPQVGAGTALLFPSLTSVASATATANAYPLPTYKFTLATTSVIPDWGITDEEVALFNTSDNLNGAPALTSAQLSGIQQVGVYDNLMGVAVTNQLYSKKTNFSKQEVAGILAGTISNWNQLFDDTGVALAAGPIVLLDRGSGSGTKAAGTQYFLTNPGAKSSGGAVDPNSVTNTAGAGGAVGTGINAGYTSTVLVLPVTGYEDVREASSGALVTDLQAANAAGVRAIGILGLEFPPAGNQVGGANQYSFAKINGVGVDTGATGDNINGPHGGTSATKYTNAVLGSYDLFYQNSFNTRTGFLTNGTNSAAFAAEALADLQKSTIAGANAGLAFPAAVPGVVLDPVTVGAQVAGVVTGSRFQTSTATLQPVYDAANTAGTIAYGSDPL
jgi:hypothetical protein